MNTFVQLLILLAIGAVVQPFPLAWKFVCPVDDCWISQCLYPNPDDCTTFWQCSWEVPLLRQCPDPLVYNDGVKVCVWPSIYPPTGCQMPQPTQNPTSSTTTASEAPVTTGSSSSSSTTARPTPPSCDDDSDDNADADLDLATLCGNQCAVRRLIANPNSQQRYIECNGGHSNKIKTCSLGLLFDTENLTCNYAGLVNPNGTGSK